jgi:pimeloyl-ACP methyl ester carboxylesterase
VRTHSISPPRVALPNRLLSWASAVIANDYTADPDHRPLRYIGRQSAEEFESKPRTFLPASSGTKRRGKSVPAVAMSALCLLIAGYLVVGYRSLDSYVTSEPVSSAEAYRNEVASILSSDEISPHTQQTLSLLPDATSAVRHSDLVLSLESSERVADADRWVALSELLLEQAQEALPEEADRARKLYLQSAFYAYRFLFSPEHLSVDQAFDQRYRLASHLYATAVGRYFLALVHSRKPLGVPMEELGLERRYTIGIEHGSSALLARYFDQYLIARELRFKGLRNRYTRDGIGMPLIAIRTRLRQFNIERFLPGAAYAAPVTVVLQFEWDDGASHVTGRLRLCDPRLSESVSFGGEKRPLAADFTAPYAYMLSRADDRISGWWGLVGGPERVTRHGVLIYGAYDTARIPVLMIHGLGASPQSWRELTNDILGSPDLRSRYQILHYTYPTNGPMLSLARQMRRDLSDFFDVVDPEHVSPPMVVIGHSMGGLLAKSLAVESGMSIWNSAFTVRPPQLHAPEEIRRSFSECFILKPWPNISRLIFLGVPQHGSEGADLWWAHVARRLIAPPDDPQYRVLETLHNSSDQMRSQVRPFFRTSRNTSVDTLSPQYPPMQAFAELPISSRIPFHSIIGSIGDGRSDGYVSVQSAHLEGARSELILPLEHSAFDQAPVLNEIHRILAMDGG